MSEKKAPKSPSRSKSKSGSRSRSRSLSNSRSRSRSRSRKHRYSSRSRSRSRSQSASHGRDRNYPREYQNNRGYSGGYNRGYRRPYYYRPRGRGFFPRGRYQRGGGYGYNGYRSNNWQNQRGQQSHEQNQNSPRRGRSRSRSRTPRRRSGSPCSRSRSRYSDRSSSVRSRRSSSSPSSRSSSPPAKRSTKETKERAAEEKGPAASDYASPQMRSAVVVSQGLPSGSQTGASSISAPSWKSIGPAPTSKSPPGPVAGVSGFGFFSKEDQKAGEKTAISSAFKKFLAEHQSKKGSEWEGDPSAAEGGTKKSSVFPYPAEEVKEESRSRSRMKEREAEDEPKPKGRAALPSRGSLDDTIGKWAELAPLPPAKDVSRPEEECNDLEDMEEELYLSRKQERAAAARREREGPSPDRPPKGRRKERPGDSPPRARWGEEDLSFSLSSTHYEQPTSSDVLAKERRISRDLVHPGKDKEEFRSIFHHIQAAQFRRSPSELFAQHIVTIVHHIKAQHFPSPEMTLNERFSMYQRRAAEKEMRSRKSPEIHRRIDISPSAFKKYSHQFEEVKHEEVGYKDMGKKARSEAPNAWLEAAPHVSYPEREHRPAGREPADSPGSTEKPAKHRKKSKKSKKKRSRSSSSSSSSSRSYRAPEKGAQDSHPGEEGFSRSCPPPPLEQAAASEEKGHEPGVFHFRIRGRGWNRGNYSRNGNPPNTEVHPPEEEWDPEYTPKSRRYYLHDDRGGDRKWLNPGAHGRGSFPHPRGQYPGARGGFLYPKGSPKWTHDKFQSGEEEGELREEDGELGPPEVVGMAAKM